MQSLPLLGMRPKASGELPSAGSKLNVKDLIRIDLAGLDGRGPLCSLADLALFSHVYKEGQGGCCPRNHSKNSDITLARFNTVMIPPLF